MSMILLILSASQAATPYPYTDIQSRLEETNEFRALRKATDSPTIPQDAYKLAAKGKIATGVVGTGGSGPKKAWGVAVLPLSIETLWAGINDEFANSDYSPVNHTAIVKGKRCEAHRTVVMVLPIPILSDRWWMIDLYTNTTLEEKSNQMVQELSWQEVSNPKQFSMDEETKSLTQGQVYIEFTRGAWYLTALDESNTLGEYYTWADPGGYIPDAATTFAASSIVETFEGMVRFTAENPNLKCLK
jgi:hypothetical protein